MIVLDMNLPKDCRECPFNEFDYVTDKQVYKCFLLSKQRFRRVDVTEYKKSKRPEDCPVKDFLQQDWS